MSSGHFLGMVGALIWDSNINCYLILKRSDEKDYARNVWECGTGRVDQGETFSGAIHREMKEELGVNIEIDFIIGTSHFYRGEKIPENEMLGLYYGCTIEGQQKISLSWEHSEYRWVTIKEAEELLSRQYWLFRLIQRAEIIRSMIPKNLLEFNRKKGFEC